MHRIRIHKGSRREPPRPIYTAKLHSIEGCRFIVSEDAHPPVYCGKTRRPGSSYCEAHHQLTHVAVATRIRVNGVSV